MDFLQSSRPTWYALAIVLLPLAAFLFNAFTYRSGLTRKRGWVVPVVAVGVALYLSIQLFRAVIFGAHDPGYEYRSGDVAGLSWTVIDTGTFDLVAGILIDNLTAVMLVVVTVVSFLVHVYSIGYMHGDPRFPRFFAFLGLFTFSMLGLVVIDNLLLLFVFWELVGVCSYFLIGFWFEQDEPPKAGIKAFMTNRFGDVGFLLGIMLCFQIFGTLSIPELAFRLENGQFANPYTWIGTHSLITLTGLALFCGAMAKSAQVPFHVWLPDAMAGPTPVSALIHAATMVAAGVYMVGRMYFFFTPEALAFIAVIGAVTAIVAATIGMVHFNIKKVLAYSTCSQLGYMMLALGVGGFGAGLFHLYTHAFFKACLFLCSGSVIHAVHTEDMREMGGLKAKMPITYRTMLIATLALAGVPFFAGAFSKELIIEHALVWGWHGNVAAWLPAIIGIGGAALTLFYMLRLLHMTFWSEPRDAHRFEHAHESPPSMTLPLLALAVLSIFAVGWPIPLWGGHDLPHLLQAPKWAAAIGLGLPLTEHHEVSGWLPWLVLAISVGVLWAAWWFFVKTYRKRAPGPEVWTQRFPKTYTTVAGLYFFDEFYQATLVRGGAVCSRALRWFDDAIVDGAVNGVGMAGVVLAHIHGIFDRVVVDGLVDLWWHLSHFLSGKLRRLQTGNLQDYLAFAVGGTVLTSLVFLFLL